MAVTRRPQAAGENGEQREDTVPDASAPRSAETPSGVEPKAKPLSKRLVAGDVVAGKYVVERTLGMGGMGQVLAAKHVKLGTKVAIKVVHPELAADHQAVARFLREAQTMARLSSEHLVRVHDVGELPGGVPYMIMDYLEGKDLSALLVERGPLPVALALDYVRQACDALAEAHAAGIIHRDVKPQNLFLVRRASGVESVRVLDFGLAKAVTLNASQQLTQLGDVMGTAQYMAPEQLRSGEKVDARTDVWGLGATLFRLLTRQYPFQETNAALAAAAALTRLPVPVESIRPDLPPLVAALVNRCLSKDPAGRFQSATELAFAIEQARMMMAGLRSSQAFVPATPSHAFVPATPSQSFVPVRAAPPPPASSQAPISGGNASSPSNAPLYVSIALLTFLLFGGLVASVLFVKRKPAPVVASSSSSSSMTPLPKAAPPLPSAPAAATQVEPPAASAPLATASAAPTSSPAKPKAVMTKPAAPATSASGKTSVYDSL